MQNIAKLCALFESTDFKLIQQQDKVIQQQYDYLRRNWFINTIVHSWNC